jgi:hypothetical protein
MTQQTYIYLKKIIIEIVCAPSKGDSLRVDHSIEGYLSYSNIIFDVLCGCKNFMDVLLCLC